MTSPDREKTQEEQDAYDIQFLRTLDQQTLERIRGILGEQLHFIEVEVANKRKAEGEK